MLADSNEVCMLLELQPLPHPFLKLGEFSSLQMLAGRSGQLVWGWAGVGSKAGNLKSTTSNKSESLRDERRNDFPSFRHEFLDF